MAPSITQTAYIEVNLSDFSDEDIAEEMENRGLLPEEWPISDYSDDEIYEEAETRGLLDSPDLEDKELEHIRWEWQFGSKREALILLEKYLELDGLSQLNF